MHSKGKIIVTSIILILFLSLSSILHSQSLKGLGIELGAGHNQLFWKADIGEANRTKFFLTYTLQFIYDVSIFNRFSIIPFIGYNRFGGKSDEKPNGYKDKYWIDAIDGGFHILYKYNKIRFGTGLKYSRHVRAISESYGSITDPPDAQRSWKKDEDVMFFFKKYSFSVLFRTDFKLYRHIFFIFESWFGLNNFANKNIDDIVTIKQNHYRLLFGFLL